MSTKDQERKALEKIATILEETGPDSYLNITFAGVLEQAEENITNDFGSNYKEMYERSLKTIEELKRDAAGDQVSIERLQETCDEYQKELEDADERAKEEHQRYLDEAGKLVLSNINYNDAQQEIETLKREIITLKAKIYDLMTV